MRHNPASGAIVIMLRNLEMHGIAQAVSELTEQGAPAFEAVMPILSQLLKAETAEREVRSTAYQLKAGSDIVNMSFIGQNNSASDIASIVAGRDVRAISAITYGPGDFPVEAGRNLGPLYNAGGLFAVGDGSNCDSMICGSVVKPYLPVVGADVTVLFGTGGGMDIAAAIAAYVDPAAAKTGGIDYLPIIAKILGVSEARAWAAFRALPAARQIFWSSAPSWIS